MATVSSTGGQPQQPSQTPQFIHVDAPEEVRDACVAAARAASTKTDSEAAGNIKRQLEAQFGGLWHVILGQSYGCSVAHEAGMIVSFRIGRTAVTAFSSFDESQLVRPKKAHIKLAAGQPGAAGTGAAPDEDAEDAGAQ